MPRLYRGILVSLAATAALLAIPFAYGAEYPTKAIQVINPFPPGAATDVLSRILSDKLTSILGQPVVVVNKTGGGGAVGMKAVKDAPADGYTILVAPPPVVLIPLARKGIGFALSDFTPINYAASNPGLMIVKNDAPWKSLEELIADAKKNPRKYTFGTPGTGTSGHFGLELLKMATGVDFTHVPLGGEAPVATAILGGNIHTSIVTIGTVRKHLEAGTLRALVVTAEKRVKEFPDIPTTPEKGYPSVVIKPWFVYLVHAKTPPAIVNRLDSAFREALRDSQIVTKIEKAGLSVENQGAEQAAKFLANEHKKWSEVASVAKIGQ